MKMCYRGVHYDYNPVFFNLNEQQKYFIDHSLAGSQTIQTKFLGKICQKKAISLAVEMKNTRFLGQISDANVISHRLLRAQSEALQSSKTTNWANALQTTEPAVTVGQTKVNEIV